MDVLVDKDACTGCGFCQDICPEVFEMDGDIAFVYGTPKTEADEECVQEAAKECPVYAIKLLKKTA